MKIAWAEAAGKETPPLTRGRLPLNANELAASGNTPAYAGKTGSGGFLVKLARKHPRLRGEDPTHITNGQFS